MKQKRVKHMDLNEELVEIEQDNLKDYQQYQKEVLQSINND
jgi:hypothetical protein